MQTLAPSPQPIKYWLSSPVFDSFWILGPAFISAAAVAIFSNSIPETNTVPLWVWVCFVLLIDVSHVYATLFRTYFNERAASENRLLLTAIPIICWVVGSLLYSMNEIYFWRTLAYLAVFHFARQQFGFMMLYSRGGKFRHLDEAAIYAATIYPLLFWHSHERNFSWFVNGDFLNFPQVICTLALPVYILIMVAYTVKEILLHRNRSRSAPRVPFNWPKNLLLIGTAVSWWVGIITFNSDMAFTITNVVSHGIPYMALIWLYHHKNGSPTKSWKSLLLTNAIAFFLFLAFLAYLEEGLWDGLVWREHRSIFAIFSALPHLNDHSILALLVPFLSLPQSVHYVLDGFIWRVKERENIWSA